MNKDEILKQEYSTEFDIMRQNRVVVSFHKYGPIAINFGDKLVDALATMEACVDKYKLTKNREYLLDAANYLMFEYMYPQLENTYFKATDSSESAGVIGTPINDY